MREEIVDIEYEDITHQKVDWRKVGDYALNFALLLIPFLGTLIVIGMSIYYHQIHNMSRRNRALWSIGIFYMAGLLLLILNVTATTLLQ